MLSRILGLFGWRSRQTPAKPSSSAPRHTSATAHLFEKRTAPPRRSESQGKDDAEGDFNPYNTGKFDRSASWERISKTQR
jgi:hypothetical protein